MPEKGPKHPHFLFDKLFAIAILHAPESFIYYI